MNVFEAVKQSVTTRQAAEFYGIRVRKNGMACCPFHNDRNPSLKLDSRYHCFGCQEDGDVIDFTGKLFGLSPKKAAEKLAGDFGIPYDRLKSHPSRRSRSVLSRLAAAQEHLAGERRCYQVLTGYYHLLLGWKKKYAPQSEEDTWHPLFVEALQNMDYVQYLLDELKDGSPEDRAAIVREKKKDIDVLEKKIADFKARERAGSTLREVCCQEKLMR